MSPMIHDYVACKLCFYINMVLIQLWLHMNFCLLVVSMQMCDPYEHTSDDDPYAHTSDDEMDDTDEKCLLLYML